MKYTPILLLSCLLVISCSKTNVAPTYTNVLGTWSFSNNMVSGQFNIIQSHDSLFVEKIGSFTIKGLKHEITSKVYITGTYPTLQISLQASTNSGSHLAQVFFNPATCNNKFNSMTCSYWQYDPADGVSGAASVSDNPITLTR